MASLLLHSSLRRLCLPSPTVSGGVKAYSQVVTSEGVRRTSSGVGAKARSTADEFDRLHAEKMAKSTKERLKVQMRQHAMEAAGKNPQISKEKVINDIEV
ncbi:hypothetical protein EJ110_NYTH49704 [Nymphaea thermarum]|nr:hypothetical protein EJ110_NYTH49704 [Nymphaea thermarum]